MVHAAERLGGRGGRRGGVVRRVGKLLPQLQVVQDEPVAVVGNAQTVRGLAIGGGGKVGADPGGQPCASVRALGQRRPVQRAQRGVNPVEVAAPVRGQKAVGQADLADGEPGVALQVQTTMASRIFMDGCYYFMDAFSFPYIIRGVRDGYLLHKLFANSFRG